ncbi:MAG: winged helix-turn-helix transcriptional regulator [Hyphomonadaceae bacterium]|nr:winged helix-turn-helix transcriptional regulator [Hyphomonadaceae bacterium]
MTKPAQGGRSRLRKISPETIAPMRFCACYNARLAARRLTAFYDSRLEPLGLNIAQFGLMAQIAGAQDATLGAIAERAGLDPSTLSRNLQGLVRNGLAEIVVTEEDQRKRAVWLTERGEKLLLEAIPVWEQAQAAVEATIDLGALRSVTKATKALATA